MPNLDFICEKCNHVEHEVFYSSSDGPEPAAPIHCGQIMEIYWNSMRQSVKQFEPFETNNILPGGKNIRIHSQKQLSHLCNEFGLVHTPEPDRVMRDGKMVPREKQGVIYSR